MNAPKCTQSGGGDVRLGSVLAETVGAEQSSRSGVGAVCSAERPHLQAQQDLVGESSLAPHQRPSSPRNLSQSCLSDPRCKLEHLHGHTFGHEECPKGQRSALVVHEHLHGAVLFYI